MEEKIRDFRQLEVWKKGIEIVKEIYEITANFPKHELFALTSQMRRCAVSIPSNVAEGFGRFHDKEYKQFLYVALGSCMELETHVEIVYQLNYVTEEAKVKILEIINHESRMLRNFIKRLS